MKSTFYFPVFFLAGVIFLAACQNEPVPKSISLPRHKDSTAQKKKPVAADTPATAFHYHFLSLRNKNKGVKDSAVAQVKALSPAEKEIVLRLNRVDAAHLMRLDTIIVPDKIDTAWMAYSVFPAELPLLKDVKKMLFFSYYAEAYGAYENGHLIKWGPTNMGKKATPTPTGLFFTNWKAKETISTANDEWKLKWNFNISNSGGVGFHQYDLPGYPASHSCLRLLETDAMYFYNWADQWILEKGGATTKAHGTPVMVWGAYPFGQHKPWWGLTENGAALNIPADTLNALVQPNLDKILAEQKQRDDVVAGMPQKVDTAGINP